MSPVLNTYHCQNQIRKLLYSVSLPRHISDERDCSVYEQTFHSQKSQKLPTNNSTPSTSPSLPYLIAELHGCKHAAAAGTTRQPLLTASGQPALICGTIEWERERMHEGGGDVSRWLPCRPACLVVVLNFWRESTVSIEHVNIESYSENKLDLRQRRMKRKLVYSTVHDEPRESDNSSLPPAEKCQIDYEPTHFLRCHSRKNDPADIQTQVRYDAIKHFSRKTTSLLCEI